MIFRQFLQGEFLTKEALEFLSQQQLSTQLIIILMVLIVVGGGIAFISLRGFLKLLSNFAQSVLQLKDSINQLNATESKRYLLQETYNQFIEQQFEIQTLALQQTDRTIEDLMNTIRNEFQSLDAKLDKVITSVENHPEEHEALLAAILQLSRSIETAKNKTDELPELN